MILKRKAKEEKKEETLDELKAKDSTYKEGIAGGITGAAVGGLAASVGLIGGHLAKNSKNRHLKLNEESLRKAKGVGLGVAGTGATLAAISAIKRRKIKNKIKSKEDENSEKK